MKKIQIVSFTILVISIFVSIDFGINFAYSLVPELNDGIGNRSILHTVFGIFGDTGWSKEVYLTAFENAIWFSFFMVLENIIVFSIKKKFIVDF